MDDPRPGPRECDGTCCIHPGWSDAERADPKIGPVAAMFRPLGDGNWACMHLDPATGLCRIYEDRPAFCREWWCHRHAEDGSEVQTCFPRTEAVGG
jgi:Fe-S-cluster containining protein